MSEHKFSEEEKEAFFEQHFDYEAEDAVNQKIANHIFTESSAKVLELTEQLSNGEVVDEPTFVFELSKMILAHEYQENFKGR